MGTLFGELSTAAQFFIAFLIVLALIVLTFWAIRRFGGIGLGGGAARGRQPRLAVIDAAAVDGRRRLVLIRRDNVEHLLMIGGPSDVVIEQNIVRAVPVASPREAPAPRPGGLAEVMARAAAEPPPPAPPARESPGRTAAETNRTEPAMPRGSDLPSLRHEASPRPETTAKPEVAPQPHRVAESVVRPPAAAESYARTPEMPVRSAPPLTPAKPAAEPRVSPQMPPAPPASDAELTDMAQRLEAALRRPVAPGQARIEPTLARPMPAETPRHTPVPFGAPPAVREAGKPAAKPEALRAASSEAAHPGQPDAKPKSVVDSLEQEMASLLGRPIGKE